MVTDSEIDGVRTITVDEPSESQESDSEPGRVKLTVNLPEREMQMLRKIANRRDISLTDAVRRAIAMEQLVEEVNQEGGKLLVERSDRSIQQLVLR